MMKLPHWLDLFLDRFGRHDLFTLAASLAFYTALSLAPLMLLTLFVLERFGFSAQQEILRQVDLLLGEYAKSAIKLIIDTAESRKDLALQSGWLGVGMLLFSAATVFAQLQDSINKIFDVVGEEHAFKKSVLFWIRKRFLSMGLVLALIFLAMVSLLLSTVVELLFQSGEQTFYIMLNHLSSLLLFSVVFSIIFKFIPDKETQWKPTIVAALVTSLLFLVGKFLIGIYLSQNALASAYGAAGSLIVFLIWIYYSSFILFCGVAFAATLNKAE